MKEKTPIVTVTCFRDLPLLDLQAQSIANFLDKSVPVYLIVNEDDPKKWFEFFDANIRHYYKNHNLIILTKLDFAGDWHYWIPSDVNPWAIGWETQQVLKLCIAEKINETRYLILDSQNFLIRNWSPEFYDFARPPARPGHFVMPMEIWDQYCKSLNVQVDPPTSENLSICTPFFFNTLAVRKLIEFTGGTDKFPVWFKKASKIKSEFILYALWLEKLGGLNNYHKMIAVFDDWANPYLRDCRTEEEFTEFLNFIGVHAPHSWVSANHRSWGNMSAEQYSQLCDKLKEYNLFPHFDEYRSNYIDLKF